MVKKKMIIKWLSMSGPALAITPDTLLHFYDRYTALDTSEEMMVFWQ
jgi:hypothetical protein